MNPNPPPNSPEVQGEGANPPVEDQNPSASEAPPPPPSAEALARHQARGKADYAASAAMVKDILEAGPAEGPEEIRDDDSADTIDGSPEVVTPPEAPIAADFFTSAPPKKRFRLRK